MVRLLAGLLVLPLCWPLAPLHAQEGRLQKVREEIRPPNPDECPKPKKKSDDDCSCDDDTIDLPIGDVLLGVILFPCLAVKHAADDPHLFLPYPYSQGEPGLMWPQSPEGPAPIVRGWLARFSVDESNDFHGLNRVNGRLLLDSACAIGLQLNWSYLDERLNNGRHDTMTIGDADVVFRLVQCPAAQWRAGCGARWATDVPDTSWGFNFTTGLDWFPVKPLVVSADLDLGTLGAASVFRGRLTGGVVWNRFELFTGYDYLRIGAVDLQGPVLGLRAWF